MAAQPTLSLQTLPEVLHIALNASAGERSFGSYHIQNVNAYQSRFKAAAIIAKGETYWESAVTL